MSSQHISTQFCLYILLKLEKVMTKGVKTFPSSCPLCQYFVNNNLNNFNTISIVLVSGMSEQFLVESRLVEVFSTPSLAFLTLSVLQDSLQVPTHPPPNFHPLPPHMYMTKIAVCIATYSCYTAN